MIKFKETVSKTKNVILAFCYMLFASGCGGSDDNKKDYWLVQLVTEGMYVLCQGNKDLNAKGCIVYVNAKDWSVKRFSLSFKQPRDIVVLKDYLCINYPDDNKIEIIDRQSFQSVNIIDSESLWGEKGIGPRRILNANQSIYVSFDAGYVGKINEKTFEAEGIEQAGSFPEGMAFRNGLIVANSDRGRGHASIGYINMLSFSALKEMTSDLLICPTDIFMIGDGEYYLDKGTVNKDGNQVQAGIRTSRQEDLVNIIDATLCAFYGRRLFVINAPKTVPETPVTFSYYDTDTNLSGTFAANGLEIPSAMGVDQINQQVYVACNRKDGHSGYVNIYTLDGQLVRRVETEANPIAFGINYESEIVE